MPHYMIAHGHEPAATQYPATAGLLTALLSEIAATLMLRRTGAIQELSASLGISITEAYAFCAIFMALAGVLYGAIFQRAANDRRGGWLLGLAYGYLLWMVGPVTLLQWVLQRPLIIGVPALALMGSQLLFGLLLGLLYPWMHLLIQRRLDDVFLSWYYSRAATESAEHTKREPRPVLRERHAR